MGSLLLQKYNDLFCMFSLFRIKSDFNPSAIFAQYYFIFLGPPEEGETETMIPNIQFSSPST